MTWLRAWFALLIGLICEGMTPAESGKYFVLIITVSQVSTITWIKLHLFIFIIIKSV